MIAAASWPSLAAGELAAVGMVLRSGVWLGGPETAALELEWAELTGVRYCVAVSSCSHALHASLVAADARYGEEVLVPAYTFAGTVHPVVWLGAVPRFVDVDPRTGRMDPEAALTAVRSGRVRAAVVVHLHGDVWPWTADLATAAEPRIVVEDACQAHGARFDDGRRAGAVGALGAFSLNAVKNLPAGTGGLITTDDQDVAREVREFCSYGRRDEAGELETIGHAYPITELAAAVARARLPVLEEQTRRAARHATLIRDALSDVVGVPYFGGVAHKLPLLFRDGARRQQAQELLTAADVPAERWQTAAIALQPVYGYRREEFPGAAEFVERSLMLGTERHPLIAQTDATIDQWIDVARPILEEVQS